MSRYGFVKVSWVSITYVLVRLCIKGWDVQKEKKADLSCLCGLCWLVTCSWCKSKCSFHIYLMTLASPYHFLCFNVTWHQSVLFFFYFRDPDAMTSTYCHVKTFAIYRIYKVFQFQRVRRWINSVNKSVAFPSSASSFSSSTVFASLCRGRGSPPSPTSAGFLNSQSHHTRLPQLPLC